MNLTPVKKKIIYTLFILAVILLAANIIADKSFHKSPVKAEHEIDGSRINIKFLDDLQAFGLKRDWIKDISNKKNTSAEYAYSVSLPKDLPIPVVLEEVYGSFDYDEVDIKGKEKTIGGETKVDIYSGGRLKLTALFNYNDKITRDAGTVGLIITGLEDLNSIQAEKLIEFPQTYAAALLPSKASVQLAQKLTSFRKEYAVLLNDDISEMDFKLSPRFSANRLRSVIRSIVGAFPKAVCFIADNTSNLYSSAVYPFIREELTKRNIKVVAENAVYNLPESGASKAESKFRSFVISSKTSGPKLIVLPADEFETVKPEIFSLIKIGYKFINPSTILFPPPHENQ